MDHEQVIALLPAYLDNELSVGETIAVERHLDDCPACREEFAAQSGLSVRLRQDAAYFEAPAHLARRIESALPRERSRAKRYASWQFNRLNAGFAMAALLAVIWSGGLYLSLPSAEERLTDELIASQVRSLQADHLADVLSSDRHTVKPWFNGKLDFSPPIVDLAQQGFPLTGGRLDYLNGRAVAVLIYRRNQHPINLYIWPGADQDATPLARGRQGFNLIHWAAGGMQFWAVSELAADELEIFARDFRS